MKHLGSSWFVAVLAVVALGALASGCGDEQDVETDRDRLDRLAGTVDGLAADLVPATERASGAEVHSWQGDYRICSDPASTDVSYVVAAQLDAFTEPEAHTRRRLVTAFEDAGWEVDAGKGAALTATRDEVTATLTVGPAATDLVLTTECLDVDEEIGQDYGERPSQDFLDR